MITLYAAVGTIATTMDQTGERQRAIVQRKGLDFALSFSEFLLWTSALWKIYHYDELRDAYSAKANSSGQSAMEYDAVLQQLRERKLIISGAGETGIDALYDLMKNAFLEPFEIGFPEKITSFFRLIILNRVSIIVAKNLFVTPERSPVQKTIWKLIRQRPMSTAELIRCAELGVENVSSSSKIVETLYDEHSNVDYKNVAIYSRFSDQQLPVLEAVANLYLGKQITLDICE